MVGRENGREEGREGRREGGRERGTYQVGGKEHGSDPGICVGARKEGREGRREGGREGGTYQPGGKQHGSGREACVRAWWVNLWMGNIKMSQSSDYWPSSLPPFLPPSIPLLRKVLLTFQRVEPVEGFHRGRDGRAGNAWRETWVIHSRGARKGEGIERGG